MACRGGVRISDRNQGGRRDSAGLVPGAARPRFQFRPGPGTAAQPAVLGDRFLRRAQHNRLPVVRRAAMAGRRAHDGRRHGRRVRD